MVCIVAIKPLRAKQFMRNKKIMAGIVGAIILSTASLGPCFAWEYLGVEIPDYINQEEIMKQIESGNEQIIEQMCIRFGACPVAQEFPELEETHEDVGDGSTAFDKPVNMDNKGEYEAPEDEKLEEMKKEEENYIDQEAIDNTEKLNDIMTEIIKENNSNPSAWESNREFNATDNVYLQWLEKYNEDGSAYVGSIFEADKYFDYLEIADKIENKVEQHNIESTKGARRSFQYNLGNGFLETSIITNLDGMMSGTQVETIYEIIAREADCELKYSALGVSIKKGDQAEAVAMKTSVYKTEDIIENLKKFGVEADVRINRSNNPSASFNMTEYVESLESDEQKVMVILDRDTKFEVKAIVKDSMVLLDAKELAEKVGGGYELEGASVRIAKGNSKLNCKIDSANIDLTIEVTDEENGILSGDSFTVKEKNSKLIVPVTEVGGTVYVSASTLLYGLGYEGVWDTCEYTLTLEELNQGLIHSSAKASE